MSDGDALEGLGLEELRERWRARFGAPPALRSPELVGLMLAWKTQAERHGGLDAEARRALRRPVPSRASPSPSGGSRLVREWQGVRHEVLVTNDGAFLYQGQRYASLSKVARRITGVRWNGPRFFGLRSAEPGR